MNTRRITWPGLLALFVVYFVWGSTYLAIRYAVREGSGFPPFTMAGTRTLLGGIILALIAFSLRQRMRLTRVEFGRLLLSGFLLWNGGNGFVTWAEQRASSGYAALVVATTPIFSAIIEALFNRQRPTSGLMLSLAIGFGGMFLLIWPTLHLGARGDLLATLALMGAPFCWSLGSTIQQRHPVTLSVASSAGWQQIFGGAGFLILMALTGEPTPHPTAAAWWAWGYLVIFSCLIAFTCYVYALRHLPMPIVMTYGYVNPVIAVLLGWFFLNETITLTTVCGMLLILAGVAGVFRDRFNHPTIALRDEGIEEIMPS